MLTLTHQTTNPVLVYHPYVALANGVYLVGHSNGAGVVSRRFWASHCCRLGGMGFGDVMTWLYTRWIDGVKPVRRAAVE